MDAEKLIADILDTPVEASTLLKEKIELLFHLAKGSESEKARLYFATLLRENTNQHKMARKIAYELAKTERIHLQTEVDSLHLQIRGLNVEIQNMTSEISRLEIAQNLTELCLEMVDEPLSLQSSVEALQVRIVTLETELRKIWASLK